MKWYILIIMLGLIPIANATLQTGLIKYVSFDQDNGTNFLPSVNDFNYDMDVYGNITRNATVSVNGSSFQVNKDLVATGSTNYTIINGSKNWNLSDSFTFSFFFRPDHINGYAPSLTDLIFDTENVTVRRGIRCFLGSNSGLDCQFFGTAGSLSILDYASTPEIPVFGVFHQIVLTYDRPSGIAKFYVDKVLRETSTSFIAVWENDTDVRIGRGKFLSGSKYSGFIDEFAYWNRSLSLCEVATIPAYYSNQSGDWSATTCDSVCPASSGGGSCDTTQKIGLNLFTDFEQYSEDTLLSYNGDTFQSKRRIKCENS